MKVNSVLAEALILSALYFHRPRNGSLRWVERALTVKVDHARGRTHRFCTE